VPGSTSLRFFSAAVVLPLLSVSVACGCRPSPGPEAPAKERGTLTHASRPVTPAVNSSTPSQRPSHRQVPAPDVPFHIDLTCAERAKTKQNAEGQMDALTSDCARGMAHRQAIRLTETSHSELEGMFDVPAGACVRLGIVSTVPGTVVDVRIAGLSAGDDKEIRQTGSTPLTLGTWCESENRRARLGIHSYGARAKSVTAVLWWTK
jgi:hypothetical protein